MPKADLDISVLPASTHQSGYTPHLDIRAGAYRFIAEVVSTDDIAILDRAARALREYKACEKFSAILIAPYIGSVARRWLAERGIGWLDLSGNADIRAEGLRVFVSGHGNAFVACGRPSSVFAPRASRVARALLMEPDRWWKQIELAQHTGLPPGTVSKIVYRLNQDGLLLTDGSRVQARDPGLLLESWIQHYKLKENDIRRFHVTARNGMMALGALAEALDGAKARWIATGMAAAWKWTHFADFRTVSAFVDGPVLDPEALGLRPVERGENVWLLVPREGGVFQGATLVEGVPCAHPIQVMLDLSAQGERARDAAAHLRETLFRGRK